MVKVTIINGQMRDQKGEFIVCEVNENFAPLNGSGEVVWREAGHQKISQMKPNDILNDFDITHTSAFNLKSIFERGILHLKIPIFSVSNQSDDNEKLKKCYTSILQKAVELQARTIVLPFVAIVSKKFPYKEGTDIAMRTIDEFFSGHVTGQLQEIIFFSSKSKVYKHAIKHELFLKQNFGSSVPTLANCYYHRNTPGDNEKVKRLAIFDLGSTPCSGIRKEHSEPVALTRQRVNVEYFFHPKRVRSPKRAIRDFDMRMSAKDIDKTAGIVIMGVVLAPLAAGAALGLATSNQRDIEILTSHVKSIYMNEQARIFDSQLTSLFLKGDLSGVFLAGVSQQVLKAAGLKNEFDIHSRVRITIHECNGETIVGSATYADPHTIVEGHMGDPGTVDISEGRYTYHVLPREVFVSLDGDMMETSGCQQPIGYTYLCEKDEDIVESTCRINEFASTCPRIVSSIKNRDIVRKIGDQLIIASLRKSVLINQLDNNKRRMPLSRRGLTVIKVSTNESLTIGEKTYHGLSTGPTVAVEIDLSTIDHFYPSGMELHPGTNKFIASNGQVASETRKNSIFTVIGIVTVVIIGIIVFVLLLTKCAIPLYRLINPIA